MMKRIDKLLLDATTAKAKQAPRLRMNYNFHEELSDPIHRLINAMEPDTYLRPHRHANPDKEEFFLLLRGKVVVFIFDDKGHVTEQFLLDPLIGNYGAEIQAGVWHGLVVLEPGSVMYEVKPGPFVPVSPDNFASWSPDPENSRAVKEYIQQLHTLAQQ